MSYDEQTGEVRSLTVAEPPRARNLIFASPVCGEVFGALCDFQGKCEPPKKTKTAKVKGVTKNGGSYDYSYQYAPLDEIHAVIKEPMAAAGLTHRQFLATMGDQWVMRTIIAHRSGEWYGCDYPIYLGQQQGQAQAFASGVTYARRYGLMLALGIVAEDDDDANVADGQAATISGQNAAAAPARGRPAQESRSGTSGSPGTAIHIQGPSDAAKADADKRWKELAASIDACTTVPEIERVIDSMAWNACRQRILDAEDEATAEQAMQNLLNRIERRKRLLLGGDGLDAFNG